LFSFSLNHLLPLRFFLEFGDFIENAYLSFLPRFLFLSLGLR